MVGIHWLSRRPRIEATFRWLEVLIFAFAIGMALACLVTFAWLRAEAAAAGGADLQTEVDRTGLLLLVLGVATLLILPVVHSVARTMRRGLGSDGERLHLRLADGRQIAMEPGEVFQGAHNLLYRQYSVPLRNKQGKSMFEPGALESHVEPLLAEERKLSQLGVLRHQWKHRDAALTWPLVSALLMALVLAAVAMILPSSGP